MLQKLRFTLFHENFRIFFLTYETHLAVCMRESGDGKRFSLFSSFLIQFGKICRKLYSTKAGNLVEWQQTFRYLLRIFSPFLLLLPALK